VTDIFHEVDEEVRREQLKKLWERFGGYIIAACVLVVILAWLRVVASQAGGAIRRGV